MPIHLLNERAYIGPLTDPVREGLIAETHIGMIAVNGQNLRAYIKRYPEHIPGTNGQVAHRGLLNELIGYVAAEALALKVPEHAGFILIDDAVHWWSQDSEWPSMTVRFDLLKLKQIAPDQYAQAVLNAKKALIRCRHLHAVIAFDDKIANSDRNLGNLLLNDLHELLLIDHGRILGGDGWRHDALDASANVRNVLREMLEPHSSSARFRSSTCAAADEHRRREPELRAALSEQLDGLLSPEETSAVIEFVTARGSATAVADRLRLVI